MMPCTQTFPIDSSRNTRFRCTDASASVQGEVYKAKDTRLERTAAVKVLRENFADSPERKARFQREAKAISQLNHPHEQGFAPESEGRGVSGTDKTDIDRVLAGMRGDFEKLAQAGEIELQAPTAEHPILTRK